jgi:hypothetical protein
MVASGLTPVSHEELTNAHVHLILEKKVLTLFQVVIELTVFVKPMWNSYPASCEHQLFYVEGGMALVHKGAGIRFSYAVLLIGEEQYAPRWP